MNYQKHYDLLIVKRGRGLKPTEGYYEGHHIIPKSQGGSDDASNIVYLTAREHFIAHWLLYKWLGTKEMSYAFRMMADVDRYGKRYKSSAGYSAAKKAHSKTVSKSQLGKDNHMYGRTGSKSPVSREVLRSDGVKFPSLTAAAKAVSGSHSKISAVCRGKRNTHQGYSWEYV